MTLYYSLVFALLILEMTMLMVFIVRILRFILLTGR